MLSCDGKCYQVFESEEELKEHQMYHQLGESQQKSMLIQQKNQWWLIYIIYNNWIIERKWKKRIRRICPTHPGIWPPENKKASNPPSASSDRSTVLPQPKISISPMTRKNKTGISSMKTLAKSFISWELSPKRRINLWNNCRYWSRGPLLPFCRRRR